MSMTTGTVLVAEEHEASCRVPRRRPHRRRLPGAARARDRRAVGRHRARFV